MDSSAQRKRRLHWTSNEVAILLELWEERIPALRGTKKNTHVFAEIAAELASRGYSYTGVGIKHKLHNLTNKYRREKKIVGVSGGSPSTWEYYEKINSFLGGFKTFNLEELVEESAEVGSDADYSQVETPGTSEPAVECSTDDSVPAKKRKVSTFQEELLKKFDEVNDTISQQVQEVNKLSGKMLEKQEELLVVEKERNVILEKFLGILSQKKN